MRVRQPNQRQLDLERKGGRAPDTRSHAAELQADTTQQVREQGAKDCDHLAKGCGEEKNGRDAAVSATSTCTGAFVVRNNQTCGCAAGLGRRTCPQQHTPMRNSFAVIMDQEHKRHSAENPVEIDKHVLLNVESSRHHLHARTPPHTRPAPRVLGRTHSHTPSSANYRSPPNPAFSRSEHGVISSDKAKRN